MQRPSSSLDFFDPMMALVEDWVAEPPEMVELNFIDSLMASQMAPAPEVRRYAVSPPPLAKRHKRVEHPMVSVSSPVSTMDYRGDYDSPRETPRRLQLSPSSSSPSSPRSERSPPRSGPGLSRKNRPQRCSICKECGHKSRTCRFANGGKGDMRPGSPLGAPVALQTSY